MNRDTNMFYMQLTVHWNQLDHGTCSTEFLKYRRTRRINKKLTSLMYLFLKCHCTISKFKKKLFQVSSRANYDKYAEQPLHYIIYYDYYNKLN